MKKIFIILVTVVTSFSCGGPSGELTTQQLLDKQKDSMQLILVERDSMLNDVLITVSDVAATLNNIKRQENLLTTNAELGKSSQDQIKEDLVTIQNVLEENRKTIARLEGTSRKLKAANQNITGLTKLVEELKSQLEERDNRIESMMANIDGLNKEVNRLNTEVATVTSSNTAMRQELDVKTEQLHTVYYIVGTEKELLSKGIIVKEGVIFKTAIVNPDIDLALLTKTDYRNIDSITIGAKNVDVIGEFPTTSYTLTNPNEVKKYAEKLVIKDKDTFWGTSKILVISHK